MDDKNTNCNTDNTVLYSHNHRDVGILEERKMITFADKYNLVRWKNNLERDED